MRAPEGGRWKRWCKAALLFFTFLFSFAPPFRFKHGDPGGNGQSPAGSISVSVLESSLEEIFVARRGRPPGCKTVVSSLHRRCCGKFTQPVFGQKSNANSFSDVCDVVVRFDVEVVFRLLEFCDGSGKSMPT